MHFLCQKKGEKHVFVYFFFFLAHVVGVSTRKKKKKKKKTGKVKRSNEQSLFLPFSGNLLIEGHFGVRDVKQPALLKRLCGR